MSTSTSSITLQKLLIRPLPLFPLQCVLSQCIKSIAKKHPRIFARLGTYADKRFLIEPLDMPFYLLLHPVPRNPRLLVLRRAPAQWDAKISGSFMNLYRLMDAEMDGDALFFSRELVVEGDTEAVVALRNALDDMDSTVIDEAAKAFGKPGAVGLKCIRKLEELHHEFAR